MRWYSTSLLLEDEGVTINGPLVLQFYAIFKRSRAAKIDIAWVVHLLFNCRKKVAHCLELRRHQLVILDGCTPLQRLGYTHHYASWYISILGAMRSERGIVNL